eukprot:CAMPEP_0118865062 /NCGR_PEP_ID=MMETSP1163-20130328/9448_1 /TAXON_ID=124430 /ORGANISM="Phaeomonas parva, Strain CCMP2877" /LENGTH=210 /DNA_ID=CAMNT_0006799255 /DNA_START=35 /DNA_END=662 /DNA_ORIENTATION=+
MDPQACYPGLMPLDFSSRVSPETQEILEASAVPLAAVATPWVPATDDQSIAAERTLRELVHDTEATDGAAVPRSHEPVDAGSIPRCAAPECRAYFARVCRASGRRWECFLCGNVNNFESKAEVQVAERFFAGQDAEAAGGVLLPHAAARDGAGVRPGAEAETPGGQGPVPHAAERFIARCAAIAAPEAALGHAARAVTPAAPARSRRRRA